MEIRGVGVVVCLFAAISAGAGAFSSDVSKLGDADYGIRSDAYSRLLAGAANSIMDIIAGADSSNEMVRAGCMKLIHEIRDPRAFDITKKLALSDSDWETRQLAVQTINSLKNEQGPAVLTKVAKEDPVPNVRVSAVTNLVTALGVAARPALGELLTNSNLLVRLTAAYHLAQFGDKSGYSIATAALSHKAYSIRMTAISVIAYAGSDADVEKLKKITADPKEIYQVKNSAAQALKHLALSRLKPEEQLSSLRAAMSDPAQGVRVWAAKEILRRKDADSLKILREFAGASDGRLGHVEAEKALRSISD